MHLPLDFFVASLMPLETLTECGSNYKQIKLRPIKERRLERKASKRNDVDLAAHRPNSVCAKVRGKKEKAWRELQLKAISSTSLASSTGSTFETYYYYDEEYCAGWPR